jgi:hypothetical protein
MDEAGARAAALSLPEAVEHDHHGSPSFRVGGKIFATLPDPDHLNVMVEEEEIRAAVAENPSVCEEQWWGRRLAAVRVDLTAADEALVSELLIDAWLRKAPRSLHARLPG